MDLQKIVHLIQLRDYLHQQANGYTMPKAQVNIIGKKITQIDKYIVDASVDFDVTNLADGSPVNPIITTVSSSDADFERSSALVLKAREGVSLKDGIVTVSAPEPIEAKPLDVAPKTKGKKKAAFKRTDDDTE